MNRLSLFKRLAALLVAPAVTKLPALPVAAAPVMSAPLAAQQWQNLLTRTAAAGSTTTFQTGLATFNNATASYACGTPGCTIRYWHGHMDASTFGQRPPDEDGAWVS